MILKHFPDARFEFFGPVSDRRYFEYLAQQVEALHLEDAVTLGPIIDQEMLLDKLSLSDVYVQPSDTEGLDRIVEKSHRGVVIRKGSKEDLAIAVVKLLEARDTPLPVSGSPSDLSEYDWPVVANRYLECYRRVLSALGEKVACA
jgi:glycosyltransferase involved in cell wall biosynthesis